MKELDFYGRIVRDGRAYRAIKRIFDIVSSFFVIILLSWLILLVLIVQLFVTKGHPFFCDRRVGLKGKDIVVFKFRSMFYDAETNIQKYLSPEQIEVWKKERKLENDPRITGFGRFLRKTSLDELPQLFNILFGTMSVVGPRPMSRRELDNEFSSFEREILFLARPGLTGYWQVMGRSNVDFASGKRQQLELEYFSKRSLLFDLKLVFLTIPAVFREKGAQ